jgi:hypothetical protein
VTIREKDGSDRLTSAESWAARKALLARQNGYFTESFERAGMPTAGGVLPTGTPAFSALPLLKGDPVTNLLVELNTAGATLTLCRFGLYRVALGGATGTLIPGTTTGDVTAQITGTIGTLVLPLAAQYVSTDDEVVYAGFVAIGTTGPALTRCMSNPVFRVAAGAQVAPCCKGASGATDLRASETFVYATTSNAFWVAAS